MGGKDMPTVYARCDGVIKMTSHLGKSERGA